MINYGLNFRTEEETKCIKERIVSIRRKIHKNTVNAVTARWNFEEGVSSLGLFLFIIKLTKVMIKSENCAQV